MELARKIVRLGKKSLLPILCLAVGSGVAWRLATSGQEPQRLPQTFLGPLVEAVTTQASEQPMRVTGNGTVQAKVKIQVVPQVAGQVIAVHPGLAAGGSFAADDILLRIDPADYQLAVQRTEAVVARADVARQLAEAEAEVARREWQRLHPDQDPPSPLVVRAPQVKQAEAELAAARADLATAQLSLERTGLHLPFAGRVISENVDIGQFVTAGQAVATVYSSAAVEIPVPLQDRELAWLRLPGGRAAEEPRGAEHQAANARATVSTRFAGHAHRWEGRLVRSEAVIDPATRLVTVVIEVRKTISDFGATLLPGMFVGVTIPGTTLYEVMAIPRHAVHDGNRVWVAEAGELKIRNVEIAHWDHESAYISEGLEDGTQVITSQLDVVTDGMQVRLADREPADREPS